jgi:ABC-type uncharacterized transport system permease subunit
MDFVTALGDIFGADAMWNSAFQLSVLFVFAAGGEWVAERAGTLNISVESMLLAGAFGAAVGNDAFGSTGLGMIVGCLFGIAVAAIQANLSHRLTANQFVVGLALNVLAVGVTAFFANTYELDRARAATLDIPVLSSIPLLGEALFARAWPAYFVYALVPGLWFLMFRTRWGLEVRAVGDNPQSADVSGIDVNARRRQAILVTGLCAGFGGAVYMVGQVNTFQSGMINGRGFIAIAAVIFGGWTLRGAIAGCVIFGLVEAISIAIPAQGYDNVDPLILDAAPYVVAISVVLVFAGKVRQPRSLAQPFVRGLA